MKMIAFVSVIVLTTTAHYACGSETEKYIFNNDTGYIVRIGETDIKPNSRITLELSTKKSVTVYTEVRHSFGSCFTLNGKVLPLKSSEHPIVLSLLVQAQKDQTFQVDGNEIYKHR